MTERVRFSPAAEQDLVDAATWYEDKRQGLGDDVIAAVERARRRAARNPAIGPVVGAASDGRPVRRLELARFPYAIVYVDLGTEIEVIAVAHGRRHPMYWSDRVKEPGSVFGSLASARAWLTTGERALADENAPSREMW